MTRPGISSVNSASSPLSPLRRLPTRNRVHGSGSCRTSPLCLGGAACADLIFWWLQIARDDLSFGFSCRGSMVDVYLFCGVSSLTTRRRRGSSTSEMRRECRRVFTAKRRSRRPFFSMRSEPETCVRNLLISLLSCSIVVQCSNISAQQSVTEGKATNAAIVIRTENYPRPPYSGATYYYYERGGQVICTKLEVCNKFNYCTSNYWKGFHKEEQDVADDYNYGRTGPTPIENASLKKHLCLKKFGLISE